MAYYLESGNSISSLAELNKSNLGGNLRKWYAYINGERAYIKSSSKTQGKVWYECESECIASRIALMLGVRNVVTYHMDYMVIDGERVKICYSMDFVGDYDFLLYADLIPNISHYNGLDKYNLVVSIDRSVQLDINNILMLDAIIYNEDRHLRNLGLLSNGSRQILPCFDNGNSLFYNRSVKQIKEEMKLSWSFRRCKPFFQTVGNHVRLVNNNHRLNKVKREDVYKVVNMYLHGERAKLVNKFIISNLRRFDLIERV